MIAEAISFANIKDYSEERSPIDNELLFAINDEQLLSLSNDIDTFSNNNTEQNGGTQTNTCNENGINPENPEERSSESRIQEARRAEDPRESEISDSSTPEKRRSISEGNRRIEEISDRLRKSIKSIKAKLKIGEKL